MIAEAVLLAGRDRIAAKRIAVIPKVTAQELLISVPADAAGRNLALRFVDWSGLETEDGRQMQIVDSMIAQHVDGLALSAADRTS